MTNQKKLSYEEACVQAATDQGLDPVVARLRAADVPVEVYQTGGFCMLAAVNHPRGDYHYIGITSVASTADDGYLVCAYDGSDDDEGRIIMDGADLDTVVDYAREYLASDGEREGEDPVEDPVHVAAAELCDALLAGADMGIAGSLTCDEAERVAELFVALDRPDDAAEFLRWHGIDDDYGDAHYVESDYVEPDEPPGNGPIPGITGDDPRERDALRDAGRLS